jgi:hypothetical protein
LVYISIKPYKEEEKCREWDYYINRKSNSTQKFGANKMTNKKLNMMFKQKNTIDIITIFCIYCKQPLTATEKHDYHTTCKQVIDEYKPDLQTLRTKPIEYLLAQEEQQLPILRNKWINALYQRLGQTINTQKTIELLEFVHPAYKDKQTELIICHSPYEAQLRANEFTNHGHQIGALVRTQVWDQVWYQVRDQVRTQVWAQIWDQVANQVWAHVWAQVANQVWAQVWAQVDTQVWAQIANQVKYYYFTESLGVNDYIWLAYYDYFSEIGLLNHDEFNCYRALVYAAKIYDSLLFENVTILIEFPVAVSDTEIVFRDNYKVIKN